MRLRVLLYYLTVFAAIYGPIIALRPFRESISRSYPGVLAVNLALLTFTSSLLAFLDGETF